MKRQLRWWVVLGLICGIGTLGASVIAFLIVYFLDGRPPRQSLVRPV